MPAIGASKDLQVSEHQPTHRKKPYTGIRHLVRGAAKPIGIGSMGST